MGLATVIINGGESPPPTLIYRVTHQCILGGGKRIKSESYGLAIKVQNPISI